MLNEVNLLLLEFAPDINEVKENVKVDHLQNSLHGTNVYILQSLCVHLVGFLHPLHLSSHLAQVLLHGAKFVLVIFRHGGQLFLQTSANSAVFGHHNIDKALHTINHNWT